MPVPIFGDGSAGRDYTWVEDIVAGVTAAVDYEPHSADGAPFDVFNLGNSHPVKLSEMVTLLERIIGKKAVLKRKSTAARRCTVDLGGHFEGLPPPGLSAGHATGRGLATVCRVVSHRSSACGFCLRHPATPSLGTNRSGSCISVRSGISPMWEAYRAILGGYLLGGGTRHNYRGFVIVNEMVRSYLALLTSSQLH